MKKIITYNECDIESNILKLNNIDLFQSNKCFFVNLKTSSNKEITKLNRLLKQTNQKELIKEIDLMIIKIFIKYIIILSQLF